MVTITNELAARLILMADELLEAWPKPEDATTPAEASDYAADRYAVQQHKEELQAALWDACGLVLVNGLLQKKPE